MSWPLLPSSPSLPGKQLQAFAATDRLCVDLTVVLVDARTKMLVPPAKGRHEAVAILGRFDGTSSGFPVAQHQDLVWLTVFKGATRRGRSYNFRLQSALGWIGSSKTFTTDVGPVGGLAAVLPGGGLAVTTPFILSTSWSAAPAVLPLSFSFRGRLANSTGEWASLTDWCPSNTTTAHFPVGLWEVGGSALDVLGLEAEFPAVSSPVLVQDNRQLSEFSIQAFLLSLTSSSPQQLLLALSALVQTLAATSPQRLTNPAVRQPLLFALSSPKLQPGPCMAGEAAKLKAELLRLIMSATPGSLEPSLCPMATDLLEEAFLNPSAGQELSPAEAQKFLTMATSVLPPAQSGFCVQPEFGEVNQSRRIAAVVEGLASTVGRTLVLTCPAECDMAHEVSIVGDGVTVTSACVPAAAPSAISGLPLELLPNEVSAQAIASSLPDPCAHIGLTGARWGSNLLGPASGPDISSASRGQCFGPVVSLSVVTSEGEEMAVNNLQQPVQLAVPVEQDRSYADFEAALVGGSVPSCRWWDPVANMWSSEGCKLLRVSQEGSKLDCACTHLTTLGAFEVTGVLALITELVDLFIWRFTCTQATVLSRQGISTLGSQTWQSRTTALIFFVFLTLLLLGWVWCVRRDVAASRALPSLEEASGQVPAAAASASGPAPLRALWSLGRVFVGALQFLLHILTQNKKLRQTYLGRCVHSLAAARLGVCRKSVTTLAAFEAALPDGSLDGLQELEGVPIPFIRELYMSLQTDSARTQGAFVREGLEGAELFLQGQGYSLWELTKAFHPVRLVSCRSLHRRHESRYLLQLMNPLCGLFFAALFAINVGDGVAAAGSDSECDAMEPLGRTASQVVVFMLTTLAGEGPAYAIAKVDHNLPLTQRTSTKSMLFLLGELLFLNFSTLCINSFYCVFVLAFISNSMEAAVQRWMLVNFLTMPIAALLVKPALWACAAAVLCRIHRGLEARGNRSRVNPAPEADAAAASTDAVSPKASDDFAPVVPGQLSTSTWNVGGAALAAVTSPGPLVKAAAAVSVADDEPAGSVRVQAQCKSKAMAKPQDVMLQIDASDPGSCALGADQLVDCLEAINAAGTDAVPGATQSEPAGEALEQLLADIM